jgi:thiol:disulfide interchange protein DsbD
LDIRLHALLIIILAIVVPAEPARAASFADQLRGLVSGPGAAGGEDFLPADEAFRFSAEAGADKLSLFWEIADGYYLYRDKFSFTIVKGGAGIRQDQVVLPAGTVKHDESFGSVAINTGDLSVDLPLQRQSGAAIPIILKVSYQGCKEDSVCYPPVTKEIPLTLPAVRAPG